MLSLERQQTLKRLRSSSPGPLSSSGRSQTCASRNESPFCILFLLLSTAQIALREANSKEASRISKAASTDRTILAHNSCPSASFCGSYAGNKLNLYLIPSQLGSHKHIPVGKQAGYGKLAALHEPALCLALGVMSNAALRTSHPKQNHTKPTQTWRLRRLL